MGFGFGGDLIFNRFRRLVKGFFTVFQNWCNIPLAPFKGGIQKLLRIRRIPLQRGNTKTTENKEIPPSKGEYKNY